MTSENADIFTARDKIYLEFTLFFYIQVRLYDEKKQNLCFSESLSSVSTARYNIYLEFTLFFFISK